jgi:hypothetical protein
VKSVAARRFPPLWSIEDIGACFIVKDSTGQKLAAVYYEEEPGRRSSAKLLGREEQSSEGGNNAIPESFAFLSSRSCVARSDHGGCKDLTYDVRADWRKNRGTPNHESARPNDDLGANGHVVRRLSRQLHRSADVEITRV